MRIATLLFVVCLGLAVTGMLSAPLALAAGIALGLTLGNPWPMGTARASKLLLQLSVVGLGFGISLGQVWQLGRVGVVYTVVGIGLTLLLGRLLGHALGLARNTSDLVSVGTAICGGSAIAALAPVIQAEEEEIGVSLATVFTLNAVALFVFPRIAQQLGLSQVEFGYWAALAIHDTSSVVAAGTVYGATALAVATTVKLARAVWIVPLTLGASWLRRERSRMAPLPWFIVGFLLAAGVRTLTPELAEWWAVVVALAKRALVVTLFLIGVGMTRRALARVGPRPLLHGALLWIVVAVATLLMVRADAFA